MTSNADKNRKYLLLIIIHGLIRGHDLEELATALRTEWLDCEAPDLGIAAPIVRVLIPRDVQGLKASDLALVKRWRSVTREAFEHYFKSGYRVVDYELPGAAKYARYGSYILEKQ